MSTPSPSSLHPWTRITWKDEPAWTSVNGAVRAIVSEARSRLIYLGAAHGDLNLLNAPAPRELPSEKNAGPNQGGHRFWLGPQDVWNWPPPREWEYCAARSVHFDGGTLTLHHERYDMSYPQVDRQYRWEGAQLRCTGLWNGGTRPWFGLHIIAVDAPFSVRARLSRSAAAPAGLAHARMVGEPPVLTLPHPAVTSDCDHATITAGRATAKLAFAPQTLRIARPGGWRLSLIPGPHSGKPGASPDSGYTSQVWVGTAVHPLAEIEQLSPFLTTAEHGVCSSTVWLEATPPNT